MCALHAVNAVFQKEMFQEEDVFVIAKEIDELERKMFKSESSNNADESGNFSLQLIINALSFHQLDLISYHSSDLRAVGHFEKWDKMLEREEH